MQAWTVSLKHKNAQLMQLCPNAKCQDTPSLSSDSNETALSQAESSIACRGSQNLEHAKRSTVVSQPTLLRYQISSSLGASSEAIPLTPQTLPSLPPVFLVTPGAQSVHAIIVGGIRGLNMALRPISPVLAPAERASRMATLVCFGAMQQCVFVFLLVSAALGMAIIVIVIVLLNLSGPGIILSRLASSAARVWLGGFVWENAFLHKFLQVITRDGGSDDEQEAVSQIRLALPLASTP